jgi:hypothetical protein
MAALRHRVAAMLFAVFIFWWRAETFRVAGLTLNGLPQGTAAISAKIYGNC